MPEGSLSLLDAAWRALWNTESPYNLPSALKTRRREGLVWFRPIGPLALTDTGPVVILNREPWGIVSVNLKNAAVSNLHTMEPVSFTHDPATGAVTAQVKFRQLKYAGDYEVRRGHATASALKIASKQLKPNNGLAAADPNDNISLAKNYQDQLAVQGGPNGSLMLDTYYRYNDNYSQAFTNPKFSNYWATYPTNGQTTQDFANHTATAASAGNTSTVSVNGPVDNTGYSDYNAHSFSMQLMLVGACNAQGNADAATAASTFKQHTDGPEGSSQTVSSVMGIVQNTPPVTREAAMLKMAAPEPEWKKKIRAQVAPHIEEIERCEDDMRRGILLHEETDHPIHAQFNAYFPTHTLTFDGHIAAETPHGSPGVEFTSVTGPFADVPVNLGAFPGKLHGELVTALGNAQFVKSILGKRVHAAIAASSLKQQMGRMLTLAMGEKLGPITK